MHSEYDHHRKRAKNYFLTVVTVFQNIRAIEEKETSLSMLIAGVENREKLIIAVTDRLYFKTRYYRHLKMYLWNAIRYFISVMAIYLVRCL